MNSLSTPTSPVPNAEFVWTAEQATALRAEMACEGWQSQDRITKQGWGVSPGYSIWFKRGDWHGKRAMAMVGIFPSYHAHVGDVTRWPDAVARAAALARRAWLEFPDCPPGQGMHGLLEKRDPLGGSLRGMLERPTPPDYGIMATITIPGGATVRVKRADGTIDTYVFRGSDAGGAIFEDPKGVVHRDVGEYVGIAVDKP